MANETSRDNVDDLKRRLGETQQRLRDIESAKVQSEMAHQRTLTALKYTEGQLREEKTEHENSNNARAGLDLENCLLTKKLTKYEWLTTAYSAEALQARYVAEKRFGEGNTTIQGAAAQSAGLTGASPSIAELMSHDSLNLDELDELLSESSSDSILAPDDEPQRKRIKRAEPTPTSTKSALSAAGSAQSADDTIPSLNTATRTVPCTKCFVHGWKCDKHQPCRNCALTGKASKCKRTKCKFFQAGTCPDGETCAYAHEHDGYEHLVQYRRMRRDGLELVEPVEEDMRRKKYI